MLEIVRGVVYLLHPRERSAWKINFLNDSEIDNPVRRMELARKELFSNQQENKQLCRRNRKLAMSLEKYKKVFALKRKACARRLQKSWSENKQEDQEQKIKQKKNKKKFTIIRVYASNANRVEGESVV